MRIRGSVGPWPVDLEIQLDERELSALGATLAGVVTTSEGVAEEAAAVAPAPRGGDKHWTLALDLLRRAGRVDGPELLAQLAALAGSEQAGKRLLVRLRHAPQVSVEQGADTPCYVWRGEA